MYYSASGAYTLQTIDIRSILLCFFTVGVGPS